MFVQFDEEHGWTDRDLLQWFSHYSRNLITRSAYLVIDGFDECPKAGRDFFLEWLCRRLTSEETQWKVAIVSRRPVKLPEELQTSREIDLSMFMTSNECLNTNTQPVAATELRNLLWRYRPELLNDEAWARLSNRIPNGDPLVQKIVLENSMAIPEWPSKLSVKELFDLAANEDSGDQILLRILDIVFQKLPDQFQVRTMLIWLLYSARPLSLWEFTSVMYPECLDNQHAGPGPGRVRDFVQICETRLRGVIEIRDMTVRIGDPRLRDLLIRSMSAVSPPYLWADIDAAQAAHDITKACLEFLARPDFQQKLELMFEQAILDDNTYGPVLDYTNFCSYAAYYWPQHAALIPTTMGLGLSSLLKEHKQTALNMTWLKAYWCLSNPVTRSRQPSKCVDVLLASLKLPHSNMRTWDPHDIVFVTERAAAQGHLEMINALLHLREQSSSALMDILIAAASNGQEELALHVLSHIDTKDGDNKIFMWPPCLIYRAAWLGMDKFAKALLEAGCSPEPGGPMARKLRVSPLQQATRHGHIGIMEVLLSHGADTSLTTAWNRSILFTAAFSGRPEVFKTLFEKGEVDMTAVDDFKMTPLAYAAHWGLTVAMKSLLQIGADPHDDKDLTSLNIGRLPLVECASRGHIESVRILLDNDADPNQPGPEGINTALWYAAVENFPQIVHVLLEKGANPNHPLLRRPILVDLVRKGNGVLSAKAELMKLMVASGARVDDADGQGRTALMHAIEARDEKAVAYLLELGASLNAEDRRKQRPLHLAAIYGSESILRLILTENPRLDCLDVSGRTALSHAIGSVNLARILLEKGANPDLTKYHGFTPLILSAAFGCTRTVEMLLDHGAQVNLQTDILGETAAWTAVSIAAGSDKPDIVKLLVDAGALLSHKTSRGSIPLHVATASTARVLLQHRKRFNIDEPNNYKTTPLHYAIRWSKSTELIKVLIDSGADLNLQDKGGNTPLSWAAFNGNREAVKLLLQEKDCDQGLASDHGWSPLHRATARNETLETVKLFVESGADVNIVGKSDIGSPLQTACRNSKAGKEMIEYLLDHGADLHAQAGTTGSAVSSAALYGTPEIISLLLQRGATANVVDAMGRTPLHFSCVGGVLNFQEIYKAGGNHNLGYKDKFQRTVFHWVAQHGLPQVLEDLIAELGTDLIDEPDIDGWTPLLWACWPGKLKTTDSGPDKDGDEPEQRQVRIFRILLENGARPDVSGKIGGAVWSLRDLALFNKLTWSCLQQVEDALTSITVKSIVPSEFTDSNKGRVGALMYKICDACYYVSDFCLDWRTYSAYHNQSQ